MLPVRAQLTTLSRLASTKPLSEISSVTARSNCAWAGPGGSGSAWVGVTTSEMEEFTPIPKLPFAIRK